MLVVSKKKESDFNKLLILFNQGTFVNFFVSKHVDASNNIRKYRTGKPECFIYTYFSKFVSKIKMVNLSLYCTLTISNKKFNVHWHGPKYPI